ncbi:hypothetical protein V6N11_025435 [Hibiscus sabdariffa]|uniref:Uncharacterized protein n=2 Tax=Hibiscus sabdariffa TaxID=183260 RepID=A0ABR2N9V6_9ROSI
MCTEKKNALNPLNFSRVFLAFLGQFFFIDFNSRCNPLICHWFYVALFVTIDAESALLPLAVVFCAAMVGVDSVLLPLAVVCCAAMEEELSRVYSLALLNPGFGIFGRRSWTVQGLGVGDLRAIWPSLMADEFWFSPWIKEVVVFWAVSFLLRPSRMQWQHCRTLSRCSPSRCSFLWLLFPPFLPIFRIPSPNGPLIFFVFLWQLSFGRRFWAVQDFLLPLVARGLHTLLRRLISTPEIENELSLIPQDSGSRLPPGSDIRASPLSHGSVWIPYGSNRNSAGSGRMSYGLDRFSFGSHIHANPKSSGSRIRTDSLGLVGEEVYCQGPLHLVFWALDWILGRHQRRFGFWTLGWSFWPPVARSWSEQLGWWFISWLSTIQLPWFYLRIWWLSLYWVFIYSLAGTYRGWALHMCLVDPFKTRVHLQPGLLDHSPHKTSMGLLVRVDPHSADPFTTRELLFSLDVHGYFWRLLTAWSMQVSSLTVTLFLASPSLPFLCRYLLPRIMRATSPRASWKPALIGLYFFFKGESHWSLCTSISISETYPSSVISPSLLVMDSELIHSMENLQFTAAESESVVMEPPCEVGDSGLWLVGSVISSKAVNGDSVCHIFRSVWKSKNVSEILELRPNFFLIKPVEKAAREMILKHRPWTVHDDLFSIEPYKSEWRAVDFIFTSMVIWKPLVGSRKKQGIEYFATNGEATEDNGGSEGETPPPPAGSRPAAGSKSTENVGMMNEAAVGESSGIRSGTSNDTSHPVTAATQGISASSTPADTEGSASAEGIRSCSAPVEPRAAVDPLVPKRVDAGVVLEACHVDEVPDPVLPTVDTKPVIYKQATVDTAPILSKLRVDNPELLLPKQVVGSTEPGLPKHLVDDIEPVLPKQAAAMENFAVGVSLTRAKRSLQGKYEMVASL